MLTPNSTSQNKKIVALLTDLFFTVKINDAAKRAGVAIEFVKSERDALEKAAAQTVLVIIDLNCAGVDALEIVRRLKAGDRTKGVGVVGYLSHVQGELKKQAQESGCDMVLPRSAFSQNLPQILKRYAG